MSADAATSRQGIGSGSIEIRRITTHDLKEALKSGLDDFWARPSHILFLVVFYPILGIAFARLSFGYNMIPLLFPLMAGFALVGPVAALGLYEISRSRERGQEPHLRDALAVFASPSRWAILRVTLVLTGLFIAWLAVAFNIYTYTMGAGVPESLVGFIREVLTTRAGWMLIILGNATGALFSVVAMAISVFALPMLLDGERSAFVAATTSIRAVMRNPWPMMVWGLIVVGLLALGSLPLFVGLIVVFPVLGHATWHLYRHAIRR